MHSSKVNSDGSPSNLQVTLNCRLRHQLLKQHIGHQFVAFGVEVYPVGGEDAAVPVGFVFGSAIFSEGFAEIDQCAGFFFCQVANHLRVGVEVFIERIHAAFFFADAGRSAQHDGYFFLLKFGNQSVVKLPEFVGVGTGAEGLFVPHIIDADVNDNGFRFLRQYIGFVAEIQVVNFIATDACSNEFVRFVEFARGKAVFHHGNITAGVGTGLGDAVAKKDDAIVFRG